MSAFYQVVFTGELLPGIDPEQATRDFAAVFKIPEEKARRLIVDRHEHVLKREVDRDNAKRYQEVLEDIGLGVRVEPAGAAAPTGEPPASAQDADASDFGGFDTAGDDDTQAGNPYAPPSADLISPKAYDDGPMTGPFSVPAGHGWLWVKEAYALFRAKPMTWIVALLTMYLIGAVVGLVPLVGSLVGFILGPMFIGGLMAGARTLDRDGGARVGMVFDGFSSHGAQLALVGLLYLLGFIVIFVIVALVAMAAGVMSASGLAALSSNDPEAVAAAMAPAAILLLVLLVLAAMIPLIMAYWFAPALVVLEDLTAVEAMQMSFLGCWRNIVPFLVYGLSLMGLMLAFGLVMGVLGGVLGAALGSAGAVLAGVLFLLIVPLMLAYATVIVVSQYTGYRDIFRQPGGGHAM
jgi:uncharacterized membrane protein